MALGVSKRGQALISQNEMISHMKVPSREKTSAGYFQMGTPLRHCLRQLTLRVVAGCIPSSLTLRHFYELPAAWHLETLPQAMLKALARLNHSNLTWCK